MSNGWSGRNVTADANAGEMDTSPKLLSARQGTARVQKHVDGTDVDRAEGMSNLAQGIASVSNRIQDQYVDETKAELLLKGKARQGNNLAMNEIDEDKQRSPVMKALLGESVTAQGANMQIAQNALLKLETDSLTNMDDYANMTTDEYIDTMSKKSSEMVQQINDPEVRDRVFDYMLASIPEISKEHYKARYARVRQDGIDSTMEYIGAKMENLGAKIGKLQFDEKPQAILDMSQDIFTNTSGMSDHGGNKIVSDTEYRALVIQEAQRRLADGDPMLAKIIQGVQGEESLTPSENNAIIASYAQYDQHEAVLGSGIITDTALALMDTNSPSAIDQLEKDVFGAYKEHEVMGSGTDGDTQKKREERLRLKKLFAQKREGLAGDMATVQSDNWLRNRWQVGAGQRSAGDLFYGTLSKKDQKVASDHALTAFIMQKTGLTEEKALQARTSMFTTGLETQEGLVTGAEVANAYTEFANKEGVKAGNFVEGFINETIMSMTTGGEEKGEKFGEKHLANFYSTKALIDSLGASVSSEQRVQMEIKDVLLKAGEGPKFINEAVAQAMTSRKQTGGQHREPLYGQKVNGKQTAQTHVKNALSGLNIHPNESSLNDYTYEYGLLMDVFNGNTTQADKVFKNVVEQDSTLIGKVRVENGAALDEELGMDFADIMSRSETLTQRGFYKSMDASPITMIAANLFGTEALKGSVPTSIDQLDLKSVSYTPGSPYVKVTSLVGLPANIPISYFKKIKQDLDTSAEIHAEERKAQLEFENKHKWNMGLMSGTNVWGD